MRRIVFIGLASAALAAVGCSKQDEKQPAPSGLVTTGDPAAPDKAGDPAKPDEAAITSQVGVEPGPVEQEGGPAAVATTVNGTVEYRALGTEAWTAIKPDHELFPGDQVRTGEAAGTTITLADESTVEVAEASTVAIGNREATADPASSIAVLAGVARISASERAPGEGPFLVYTPVGVVATKGTVFGVGVAADATARVGVETGGVVVSGLAALDAPVDVEASHAVVIAPAGTVAAPAPWPEDDWGTWRADVEAGVDVKAAADAHAAALAELGTDLDAGYTDLEAQGKTVATFEADAAAKADANDAAGYTAILPEGSAAIDASFDAGLRLHLLTYAYASRAVLVSDLYVRHPDVVVWTPIAPRVHAAVLWPKRYDVVATTYFEPLRVQYYVHHPRGRVHARVVGVTVPTFYAAVEPPPPPRAKLRFKVFVPPPPRVVATATVRPIWIGRPAVGWRAKIKVRPAPYRGKVAFWVRPATFKASAVFGVAPKAKVTPVFAVRPPVARAKLKAKFNAGVGTRIKVAAPDVNAGIKARAGFKVGAPGLRVGAPGANVGAGVKAGAPGLKVGGGAGGGVKIGTPGANVGGGAGAGVKVGAPGVKIGAGGGAGAGLKVKGGAAIKAGSGAAVKAGGATVKAGGKAAGDLKAGVKAGVKVKTPPPPKAEVKGGVKVKAGGKLKIGN